MQPSASGDVVVGVTSWGPSDCRTPYSYYVRTADHLPWIRAKMALPVTGSSGSGSDSGSGSSLLDSLTDVLDSVIDWFGQ